LQYFRYTCKDYNAGKKYINMENLDKTYQNSENSNDPNATSHYRFLAVGIIVGLIGIFSRFIIHWEFFDIIANIIFIVGILLSLKAVFDILK
jgi:hypothetical protein